MSSTDLSESAHATDPSSNQQLKWIERKTRECGRRSKVHETSRRRFHALDVSSMATTITLSTVSSAISLFGNTCTQPGLKLVTGILNLTITGLTSWYGYHKYGERKRNHERTRDAYQELSRKLDAEIVLHETGEQHFRTHGSLIRQTRNRIDRIEAEAPNVPASIAKSDQMSRKEDVPQAPTEIVTEP